MTPLKINRAFALSGVSATPSMRDHILRNIKSAAPADVLDTLTAKQLGALIAAAHRSYHDGRASTGAECLDGGLDDGLYWLGGKDGIAITMRNRVPSV